VTVAAVNALILPVPEAAKPVLILLFVQLKVAPKGVLVNAIAATLPPEQTAWFAGKVTVGVGFTVIVNGLAGAEQPFKVAVTLIVETSCEVTLAAVIAAILPIPDAKMPVLTLLFVQLKVAPDGVDVKFVAEIVEPPQTIWFKFAAAIFAVAFGLTVIVKFEAVPTHVFAVGVTVIVDTCCAAIFAAVNAVILPIPEAVKPVAVLLFAHEKDAPLVGLTKLIAATEAPEQAV
jgi:hypothetical protein